ncbi:MAG: DUF554 domain-containing protein [Paludibacter sp.]|nr:DUF554 domain-containing protein [Paludibacter sp.]
MIGTIVNAIAVLVGGSIGMLFNKSLHPRFQQIYFQATGLFTIAIGISMMKDMNNVLIVVASIAIGALIGELLRLDVRVDALGDLLKMKLKIKNEKFSEGLVTSFMLFCVGAMTIVGAIDEGIGRSSEVLFTKSLMDGFSAILLASAFGVGVLFSAIPLFLFQASISLIAMYAATFFTSEIINGLSAVGGILLIGLGVNILEVKKLRIVNMLPALLLVVVLLYLNAKFQLI